ncbi:peptidyl-prolyl cis-trans isomerase [Erysipelotrichaceae bacterium]|nr:peptidyl-prolyl cis-trans isomerase [Erysipelotrichaceae bacterium]
MMKFLKMTTVILLTLGLYVGCAKAETGENNKPTSNPTSASGFPLATIEMENGGIIVIELDAKQAPNTVANFVELAQNKFYDGLSFHRVIPGFVIQGGDPAGNGMGGPGYGITGEFSANGIENNLLHTRGVISMARSGQMDSGGSQFFIMVADSTSLDGQYASFGKVIAGMDVVDAIVSADRDANDKPMEDQRMKSVTIDMNGAILPELEKLKE